MHGKDEDAVQRMVDEATRHAIELHDKAVDEQRATPPVVPGRKPFATLADEFRSALVDTSRIGYPLEVLEPEVRRRADASCRSILPILHKSHRIVLEPDFTQLASQLTFQEPVDLARYLDLARLPFDNLWLEWPQDDRASSIIGRNYKKDRHIPKKVGVLIWPAGDESYQLIAVSGYTNQQGFATQCGPSPVGMVFSMTENIDNLASIVYDDDRDDPHAQRDIDECPIGMHYMEAIRAKHPEQVGLAEAIAAHARISIAPPFGHLHRETMQKADASNEVDVKERQQVWLGINAREINGLWRWLICVFGLYNTGGGEFVFTQGKSQKKQAYRGGILPKYEYRIVSLKKPVAPEVIKRSLPSTSTLGRRQHTVEASWHHRRLETAECSRHPKVCPIAFWTKVEPDDAEVEGNKDQWRCGVCKRLRWRVKAHPRGNKALGIVDKGIRVTASGAARTHETVEVIKELPPGLKIKSIPRIEGLEGEKTV